MLWEAQVLQRGTSARAGYSSALRGNSGAAAQPHGPEEPPGDCPWPLQWPESSREPAAPGFLQLGNAAHNSSWLTLPAPGNVSEFQHREPCAEIELTEIVLSETLRNTNIGTRVYTEHVNTENMQMLTKCDVTHQVEQLDCEVQLEEVIRLWGKTYRWILWQKKWAYEYWSEAFIMFFSYLDSLLIAIKLLLYSTNDKGKKTPKPNSNIIDGKGRIQLLFRC